MIILFYINPRGRPLDLSCILQRNQGVVGRMFLLGLVHGIARRDPPKLSNLHTLVDRMCIAFLEADVAVSCLVYPPIFFISISNISSKEEIGCRESRECPRRVG